MKALGIVSIILLIALSACTPSAQTIQTAIAETQAAAPTALAPVVVVTVVMPPALPVSTATAVLPSPTATAVPCTNKSDMGTLDLEKKQVCMLATYYPCLRWDQITADMKGKLVCVRGEIRKIDLTVEKKHYNSHWDFTDNRTGFFAVSEYQGWHPVTGKDMGVGDCVGIIGTVQVLSNGRPYIFWGANSIFKSAVEGTGGYYEHPDLWVIEGNPAFCQ